MHDSSIPVSGHCFALLCSYTATHDDMLHVFVLKDGKKVVLHVHNVMWGKHEYAYHKCFITDPSSWNKSLFAAAEYFDVFLNPLPKAV